MADVGTGDLLGQDAACLEVWIEWRLVGCAEVEQGQVVAGGEVGQKLGDGLAAAVGGVEAGWEGQQEEQPAAGAVHFEGRGSVVVVQGVLCSSRLNTEPGSR